MPWLAFLLGGIAGWLLRIGYVIVTEDREDY